MRLRLPLVLCSLALLALPSLAQFKNPTPNVPLAAGTPRSAAFDYVRRDLVFSPGEQVVDLGLSEDESALDITVSTDGARAAWCQYSNNTDGVPPILVVRDLARGVNLLEASLGPVNACSLGSGSFSPLGDRIAVGALTYNFGLDPSAQAATNWTYTIYDVLSGRPLNQALGAQFGLTDDIPYLPVTQTWDISDRLIFYLRPYYIEGAFQNRGAAYEWDLRQNTILPSVDPIWGEASLDFLPNTGERLWLALDLGLTQTIPSFPYAAGFNVIKVADSFGERTIYHIGDGWLSEAYFSDDGQEIIAEVYVPDAPDSFEASLFKVRIQRGGLVSGREAPDAGMMDRLPVWRDVLGVSASPSGLTFAAVEGQAIEVVTCPGFMPSRLLLNRSARVTPGTPNNLREQPSSSSPKIGEIPGGGVVYVMEGPICDTAGRAWWKVDYNGIQGWTAEGAGSDYYMEPLP